jgi:hypothetical protein
VKVGLLELAKQLGNVSQACKMMGYHPRRSGTDGSQTRCWRRQSRANPSLEGVPGFSPTSWEFTVNFIESRFGWASIARKIEGKSVGYGEIPYALEQGIFRPVAGN